MRKLEGIEACRNCVSRNFVNGRGLVCKQTNNIPDFEGECADFIIDEELIKSAPLPEESVAEEINMEALLKEENLPSAIIWGLLASVAGAIIWGLISVSANIQMGIMAVGMGFIVGHVVRAKGKGIRPIFGIVGALLSLFGCFLGDFLSIIGFVAKEYNQPFIETLLHTDFGVMANALFKNLFSMTALFYGIALFEGYKLSFRLQIKEGGKI